MHIFSFCIFVSVIGIEGQVSVILAHGSRDPFVLCPRVPNSLALKSVWRSSSLVGCPPCCGRSACSTVTSRQTSLYTKAVTSLASSCLIPRETPLLRVMTLFCLKRVPQAHMSGRPSTGQPKLGAIAFVNYFSLC